MSKRVKFILFHRFCHFHGKEKCFIISFTQEERVNSILTVRQNVWNLLSIFTGSSVKFESVSEKRVNSIINFLQEREGLKYSPYIFYRKRKGIKINHLFYCGGKG